MATTEGGKPLSQEEAIAMDELTGAVVDQVVEVEIAIQAPADLVFDFLVEPEKLLRWLGQDGTIDPRPGGELRVKISDDDTAVGNYVEIDRPKHLVFTWGWEGSDVVPPGSSTVELNLREEDDHTVVSLMHSGLPDDQPALHLEGWQYFGRRLIETVEGAGS